MNCLSCNTYIPGAAECIGWEGAARREVTKTFVCPECDRIYYTGLSWSVNPFQPAPNFGKMQLASCYACGDVMNVLQAWLEVRSSETFGALKPFQCGTCHFEYKVGAMVPRLGSIYARKVAAEPGPYVLRAGDVLSISHQSQPGQYMLQRADPANPKSPIGIVTSTYEEDGQPMARVLLRGSLSFPDYPVVPRYYEDTVLGKRLLPGDQLDKPDLSTITVKDYFNMWRDALVMQESWSRQFFSRVEAALAEHNRRTEDLLQRLTLPQDLMTANLMSSQAAEHLMGGGVIMEPKALGKVDPGPPAIDGNVISDIINTLEAAGIFILQDDENRYKISDERDGTFTFDCNASLQEIGTALPAYSVKCLFGNVFSARKL